MWHPGSLWVTLVSLDVTSDNHNYEIFKDIDKKVGDLYNTTCKQKYLAHMVVCLQFIWTLLTDWQLETTTLIWELLILFIDRLTDRDDNLMENFILLALTRDRHKAPGWMKNDSNLQYHITTWHNFKHFVDRVKIVATIQTQTRRQWQTEWNDEMTLAFDKLTNNIASRLLLERDERCDM